MHLEYGVKHSAEKQLGSVIENCMLWYPSEQLVREESYLESKPIFFLFPMDKKLIYCHSSNAFHRAPVPIF